jgi:hypothetical protein
MGNMTDPLGIATAVFNANIEIVSAANIENEKRAYRFQKPLPVPEFDVQEMVETTRKLVSDVYATQTFSGNVPKSTVDDWKTEALYFLKQEIRRYARLDGSPNLMKQINEIWPDTCPPRDLNEKEKNQLNELQKRLDEVFENTNNTLKNVMQEILQLSQAEHSIIIETNAHENRLIHRQIRCYINLWNGILNILWSKSQGQFCLPLEQVERDILRELPRKWVD